MAKVEWDFEGRWLEIQLVRSVGAVYCRAFKNVVRNEDLIQKTSRNSRRVLHVVLI